MIKLSLITLFTSVALLFSAILADGVVIDHNLPANLQPGENTTVIVNINKGEVTGFAKLQLEIPAGLTARAIKKSGASFTFSGQKAKFIWMTLPATQEFQVEYELEANINANGSKVIEGQFSYIKENERVDYDLSPQIISVGTEDVLVDNTTDETQTEANNTSDDTTTQLQSDVVCTRTLTPLGDGKYFVEVSVYGVETDGFAKIREEISAGFRIKEDASGEAIVTLEENGIKYVWFEQPSDPNHSVSYTLTSTSTSEFPEIDGKFSYVANNQPMEISIVQQEMINSRDFGGNDTEPGTETTINPNEGNTEEVIVIEGDKVNELAIEVAMNATEDQLEEIKKPVLEVAANTPLVEEEVYADSSTDTTNTPSPEEGVNYKIQLAATHKYVAASKFKTNHKFAAAIQTENHDGWTKFVTGSHNEYKSARDARNNINAEYSKFNGPFVTAYNNGERITVQEALMVSKQKWYQ
ncbi:MAG: hypothetical protein QMB20_05030 [Flavobacteriales bacterium]